MTATDRADSPPARHGSWQDIVALVVLVAIALLAGRIGSLATTPNIPIWYDGLEKPWFNPPTLVFPIVWTILFILMGVAAWLAWRAPERRAGDRVKAMAAYLVQLVVNVAWSFAFFGAQSPLAGLVVVVLLFAAVAVTILAFRRLSRVAAILLAPYLAWVGYATLLNATILGLNG